MHENVAALVLEAAVAEFAQTRVLFAGGPAEGLEPPARALDGGVVAVVGGEQKRRARATDGGELAQGAAAVAPKRDLHEAVEHEEAAGEGRGGGGGGGGPRDET